MNDLLSGCYFQEVVLFSLIHTFMPGQFQITFPLILVRAKCRKEKSNKSLFYTYVCRRKVNAITHSFLLAHISVRTLTAKRCPFHGPTFPFLFVIISPQTHIKWHKSVRNPQFVGGMTKEKAGVFTLTFSPTISSLIKL